jgi:hypothetical protein
LRRAAYRLGVSLYGLLSGRIEPVTRALDPAWLMDLPSNLAPRPKRRKIDRPELLEALTSARRSFQEPPPLSQLAAAAETTAGAIEYHFPAFAAEVKSAHQRLVRDRRQRKQELARTLIFRFLAEARQVSRKAAQRYVADRSELSKNQIRELVARYVPPAGGIRRL